MPRTASTTAPLKIAPTLECFKAGRRTALSGAVIEFAQSDLAATAGAYDPALHEAPLVIGHPTLAAPAYGWVSALRLEGQSLEATPRKVDPVFAQAVQSGSYGKVSAAFFRPDAANNPVPGVFYLKHIGFLGATPPAVQGMRDPAAAITDPAAAYADTDPGVVVFSDWSDADNAGLWRTLRDWLLSKFGQADADTAVPGYLVQSLDREAQAELARAADAPEVTAGPAFAQQPTETTQVTEEQKLALEAENARLRTQLADHAAAARTARLAAAHGDAVAFADGLVASSVLRVDEHAMVVALLDTAATATETAGAALEFAQGDTQVPLVPAFKKMLAALPPRVKHGRIATNGARPEAAEASLVGTQAERKAAIGEMFPDLPAAA
jgi:hypothetical protein